MDDEVQTLRAASRHVRTLVAGLDAEAVRAAGLVDVAWVSVEADRWRSGLLEVAADIRRDARQLEAFADVLARHADAVAQAVRTSRLATQPRLARW